jgi:hypothetical protein
MIDSLPGRFLGGCGRRVLSDLIDCAASASSGLFDCTPLLYRVQGINVYFYYMQVLKFVKY